MPSACGHVLRARRLEAPLDEGMDDARRVLVGQVGLHRDVGPDLLARRHHERRVVRLGVEDRAHPVADPRGRVQVDVGRAARGLGVAVGHADRDRLLQAEDVAEVVRELGEHRQLGRAGVAEDRRHPVLPEELEGDLADAAQDPDPNRGGAQTCVTVPGRRGRDRAAPDRIGPEAPADLVDRQVERRVEPRLERQLQLGLVSEVRHRDPEERDAATADQRPRGGEQRPRRREDRAGSGGRMRQRAGARRAREVREPEAKRDGAARAVGLPRPARDPVDQADQQGVELGSETSGRPRTPTECRSSVAAGRGEPGAGRGCARSHGGAAPRAPRGTSPAPPRRGARAARPSRSHGRGACPRSPRRRPREPPPAAAGGTPPPSPDRPRAGRRAWRRDSPSWRAPSSSRRRR